MLAFKSSVMTLAADDYSKLILLVTQQQPELRVYTYVSNHSCCAPTTPTLQDAARDPTAGLAELPNAAG